MTTVQQTLFEGLVGGDDLTIRLPIFEGPLDLLLYLIRRNEVNVYDIPIESITRQYLDVLHEMENLSLEVAGEFFVMAATLMYIKSRMLLPREKRPQDETDEEGEDPRWELVQQLLEYRRFKEAAEQIEEQIRETNDYLPREVVVEKTADAERPIKPFDRFEIWNAFNLVLRRLAEKLQVGEIHEEPITVADRMADIVKTLESRPRFRFSELFADRPMSIYLLTATFLAILELTRLRTINLFQNNAFSDIDIEKASDQNPPDLSEFDIPTALPEPAGAEPR